MNYLKRIFTLDLRALATFRIFLGTTLLLDMITRLGMSRDFYSDLGTLPRSVLIDQVELPWKMSLLMINGSPIFAASLAVIGILAAILLILGKHTRASTLVGWVILASFHARHPLVAHGGDNVLRMLLFWGIFLPLSKRWALDSKNEIPNENKYFGPFNVAISLQVLFIYIFTFFYKWHPSWLSELDSFYYAMNLSMFTTPLGDALLNYPLVMKALTFATLWFEGLGPLLFLCPHRYARRLMVFSFIALHVGIELTMILGLFPLACITAWTLFIDSDLLDRIDQQLSRFKWPKTLQPLSYQSSLLKPIEALQFQGKKSIALSSLLTLLVFSWNLEGIKAIKGFDIRSPINEVIFALQLNQQWNMFAPRPMRHDGYFVVEGHLNDNEFIDPMTGQRPLMYPPEDFASTFKSTAWNKYLLNLYSQNWSSQRLYFGKYLCRKWNSEHPSHKNLNNFKIYFMRDVTPRPGEPRPPLEKVELWNHQCFAGSRA